MNRNILAQKQHLLWENCNRHDNGLVTANGVISQPQRKKKNWFGCIISLRFKYCCMCKLGCFSIILDRIGIQILDDNCLFFYTPGLDFGLTLENFWSFGKLPRAFLNTNATIENGKACF